ncbi:hypothetical protein [Saprospira grandis]|uniref:Uncharacterized protein n=1 Tax=Saprospira grandis (strain Lewin) TaxID=984262 RepID=H6KZ16_SAPGL|nr:hypothetical protein [Saprospira grandis]AFC23300.1 hypothetical protein SGRA_0561 [Saprospira grandis str. Lewin]
MTSLQEKMQDYKLSKKMLKAFYGISYPTLRKRLRAAGLEHFIGRRKFLFAEFLLIFKALGQPAAILEEVAELALIYEQLISLGLLKGQSQKDLPQKGQKKEEILSSSPKLWLLQKPLALLDRFIALYYQVLLKGWELLYGPTENYAAKQAA